MSTSPVPPQRLLTVKQAAERLNVSTSTIERLIKSGVLPLHRVGPRGPRRFYVQDVDRALIPAQTPDQRTQDIYDFITSVQEG